MTAVLVAPAIEPQRDRWGRPLVVPPGGGRRVGYRRVTTFIAVLDDRWNLEAWKRRQVALGLADRPDLLLAVTAHRGDKKRLDRLCDDAMEAAKSSAGATIGTAVHALTQLVDRGQDLPVVPDAARADLEAYRAAMAPFDVVAIEQFGVLDDLQVAGTWDRVVEYAGRRFIADVKTGSDLSYSWREIAMQLALYSRCQVYDVATDTRTPLGVDQRNGLVVHVPAGTGRCDLYWLPLEAGWQGVEVARQVWDWRSRDGLAVPFRPAQNSLAAVAAGGRMSKSEGA